MNVRRRGLLKSSVGLACLFSVGISAGCSKSDTPRAAAKSAERVSVELKEWGVTPDKRSVPAGGKVTFKAKNAGTMEHELVILKTSYPIDALPTAEGKVKEEAAGEVIGEIEEFPPNEEREATFDLPPGSYILFCNVSEKGQTEGHYQKGMRAAFTVGPASGR
ncbi:MAG TPA: cupredoxin domain-containing protein [Candidatus Manganitrophaceae bacterium]|nr:cupredoxin domain-containing protein [Candidatus Manganitrophaceae bacterium]